MHKLAKKLFVFLFCFFLVGCHDAAKKEPTSSHVKLGVEVLFEENLDLIRGKRVGLITNQTGVDGQLNSTIMLFKKHPEVKLVALYGPEHGIRGDAQAGEFVPYYFDSYYQLPVYSLYGQSQAQPKNTSIDIDAQMRLFDTQHTGKTVNPELLKSIDVMVFDMQDVGTRIYTYIATMSYAMQACADANIPFIVLDRPNPINGSMMEGPVLEYPKYSSFIGLYPIPIRHGMTIGELALLFNEKFLLHKAKLSVVPMENWQRKQWIDETSLTWLSPSPNLPTLNSAIVYPGQVLLEGTNLSEGRGTTAPFEIFGAPWIDGSNLTNKLNELHFPGVTFHEIWFTPSFSKFQNQLCSGSHMFVTDRNAFQPIATTLAILSTIKQMYGDKLKFYDAYFDKVLGTSRVREALERGEPIQNLIAETQRGLKEFAIMRDEFLLY
ncbi:MAG: exo-beta-N-acetylmuramidase NamZ family protein [Legionella sp.]